MKKFISLVALSALMVISAFAQESWPVYANAGVPSNGTTAVYTLTIQTSTSGGSFTLTIASGRTSAVIPWNATNATLLASVKSAVEGLNAVGANNTTVAAGTLTAGIGTITITMAGNKTELAFPAFSVTNNLITGGTIPTITNTTPGVTATFRDAKPGVILVDNSTPGLWFNASATRYAPTWTQITIP